MPTVLAAFTGFWPTVRGVVPCAFHCHFRFPCPHWPPCARGVDEAEGSSGTRDVTRIGRAARGAVRCSGSDDGVRAAGTMSGRTVDLKPVKAAKILGMFQYPESLNSARIDRMTPSMDSLFEAQSYGGGHVLDPSTS